MGYEPKVGDILNFSWGGFLGFAIRIKNYTKYGFDKEKNKWTHTAIVGNITKKGKVIVYEALYGGFQRNEYTKTELNKYRDNGNMTVLRSKYELENVKKHCEEFKGRPYAYHQIAILAYAIFGDTALTKFSTSRALICSEAVSRILYNSNEKINLAKEFNKKHDYIIPLDFMYSKHFKNV